MKNNQKTKIITDLGAQFLKAVDKEDGPALRAVLKKAKEQDVEKEVANAQMPDTGDNGFHILARKPTVNPAFPYMLLRAGTDFNEDNHDLLKPGNLVLETENGEKKGVMIAFLTEVGAKKSKIRIKTRRKAPPVYRSFKLDN